MPRPRKLTLKEAEKRIRARNPEAWDASSPAERATAVALFNTETAKPDAEAFIRGQLSGTGRKSRR